MPLVIALSEKDPKSPFILFLLNPITGKRGLRSLKPSHSYKHRYLSEKSLSRCVVFDCVLSHV